MVVPAFFLGVLVSCAITRSLGIGMVTAPSGTGILISGTRAPHALVDVFPPGGFDHQLQYRHDYRSIVTSGSAFPISCIFSLATFERARDFEVVSRTRYELPSFYSVIGFFIVFPYFRKSSIQESFVKRKIIDVASYISCNAHEAPQYRHWCAIVKRQIAQDYDLIQAVLIYRAKYTACRSLPLLALRESWCGDL